MKIKEESLFTFPLLSSQFHFLLQPNECILSKIHTLSLLSVFLLLQIPAQPLFQIHFKETQA